MKRNNSQEKHRRNRRHLKTVYRPQLEFAYIRYKTFSCYRINCTYKHSHFCIDINKNSFNFTIKTKVIKLHICKGQFALYTKLGSMQEKQVLSPQLKIAPEN